jgi:hypothetical protein
MTVDVEVEREVRSTLEDEPGELKVINLDFVGGEAGPVYEDEDSSLSDSSSLTLSTTSSTRCKSSSGVLRIRGDIIRLPSAGLVRGEAGADGPCCTGNT